MARGGSLLVWADHGDPVTAAHGFGRQGLDSLGENPVVIADQDA
jgi:hypothetical protein